MKIQVRKPTEREKLEMQKEAIWTCEASEFDWHYDEKETCLILEGEVTVKSKEEEIRFGPGDFVVFPEGLDCRWQVKKPVRKHYKFG
jgi:uncharacterized cupin superfamily protein